MGLHGREEITGLGPFGPGLSQMAYVARRTSRTSRSGLARYRASAPARRPRTCAVGREPQAISPARRRWAKPDDLHLFGAGPVRMAYIRRGVSRPSRGGLSSARSTGQPALHHVATP